MEALLSHLVTTAPLGAAPQAVCAELLRILQQYPSGLTEAVIATQLLSALKGPRRSRGKRHVQDVQAEDDTAFTPDRRSGRLPEWWLRRRGLGAVPLADCLTGRQGQVVVYAEIQASAARVPAAGAAAAGAADAAASGAPVLRLSDGSTREPVSMFLHSAHLDLTDTLLFEEGVRLRCATVAVSPPHGCPGLPPLMPTSQVVVEVPLTSWLQLDSLGPPQAKILKHPVRTLHCALAFTNGAAPRAGAAPLSGWVVAQVAKVGGVTSGAPWNARSSVTVSLSEAAAFAGSISNGSWEDDGGKAVARQGGGQHAAKAQVALVLRDDQTALGQLLCEGETVALLGAALLSPEPLADPGAHGMQPLAAAAERDGAGGGCSGSEGRVLLLGQRYLVVAPSVPGSEGTGEPGAMEVDGLPCQQQQQQHQQQQQQQQQHQQQQQQQQQ